MIIYTALCLLFFFFSAKSRKNLAKVHCSPAGYQLMFFKFSLPMVLCWRASRAAAPPWQTDQRNRSNFVMSEFVMALHFYGNYFWNSSSFHAPFWNCQFSLLVLPGCWTGNDPQSFLPLHLHERNLKHNLINELNNDIVLFSNTS